MTDHAHKAFHYGEYPYRDEDKNEYTVLVKRCICGAGETEYVPKIQSENSEEMNDG